jgi:predicted pyridoxine 5'-phosphate oxidase superfamily flavin-nucleotide-binding protein
MMAEVVYQTLPEALQEFLQGEKLVLVSTTDHETGAPNTSAISWLIAKDGNTIRFAVDPRSRLVANLNKDPRITLAVLGLETCYGIMGRAKVATEPMAGVSLKMVMVEVEVEEVRDIMFYGGKLTTEPQYEKTYDPKLAKKFDSEVYNGLRQ